MARPKKASLLLPPRLAGGGGGEDNPLGQAEADAVAALLDFGADAGNGNGNGAALEAGRPGEPEFLVKFAHRSHVHNEWVPESVLAQVRRAAL